MPNQNRSKFIASALLIVVLAIAPMCYVNATAALSCVKTVPNGFVCLTIDDGYGRDKIKKDLDILRAYHVHCTFFVIGTQLSAYPDLWRQAVRDGHEICYHTMKHQSVSSWSNSRIVADLKAWNATAKKVLGTTYSIPRFVRLPGGNGSSNQRILKLFNSYGYRVVYWSMDTLTGAVNRHKPIDKYIKANTKKGSVILTHFNSYDASALPKYIGWLKAHFKLGTLSQAFAPPLTPTPAPTHTPTPAPTTTASPSPTPTDTPVESPTESPTVSPDITLEPTPTETTETTPTVTTEPPATAPPEPSPTASPSAEPTAPQGSPPGDEA